MLSSTDPTAAALACCARPPVSNLPLSPAAPATLLAEPFTGEVVVPVVVAGVLLVLCGGWAACLAAEAEATFWCTR
jgi:hypothetical protein